MSKNGLEYMNIYIGIFSLDLYLKYHWNMHTFNEFIILVNSDSSGKSIIHVPTT